jgi:hypothetical protein
MLALKPKSTKAALKPKCLTIYDLQQPKAALKPKCLHSNQNVCTQTKMPALKPKSTKAALKPKCLHQ